MSQDYYSVLGVSETANADEIKETYRELVKLYHPDRNSRSGAEEKFKELQAAYEVLSDPRKRKDYDQERVSAATKTPNEPVVDTPEWTQEEQEAYNRFTGAAQKAEQRQQEEQRRTKERERQEARERAERIEQESKGERKEAAPFTPSSPASANTISRTTKLSLGPWGWVVPIILAFVLLSEISWPEIHLPQFSTPNKASPSVKHRTVKKRKIPAEYLITYRHFGPFEFVTPLKMINERFGPPIAESKNRGNILQTRLVSGAPIKLVFFDNLLNEVCTSSPRFQDKYGNHVGQSPDRVEASYPGITEWHINRRLNLEDELSVNTGKTVDHWAHSIEQINLFFISKERKKITRIRVAENQKTIDGFSPEC